MPTNYWQVGKAWKVLIAGRISNVVTTPGTFRLDFRTGPSGTIIAHDSGAIALNAMAAKTNVPFVYELDLVCRAVGNGTATTLFGIGKVTSEAVSQAVAAPLTAVAMAPAGAPAVGTGFDNTAANAVDFFFTQIVATGSLTVHQLCIWESI